MQKGKLGYWSVGDIIPTSLGLAMIRSSSLSGSIYLFILSDTESLLDKSPLPIPIKTGNGYVLGEKVIVTKFDDDTEINEWLRDNMFSGEHRAILFNRYKELLREVRSIFRQGHTDIRPIIERHTQKERNYQQ